MKKTFHRPFGLMFLSLAIPALIIVAALVGLKITPFGDNTLAISDGNALYLNYLGYVGRAVKGQEDVLFSFEKGLGGNMMGSWAWFLLNPFFALFSLFDIANYMQAYTYVSVLNFCVCGLTMYLLLKDLYGHRLSNLLFSTAYALNGFLVANVFQMNFFTCVPVLPLMIMGLRRILNSESPLLYIISLAYSLLMNFYFGFMLCAASVLIFTVFMIADREFIADKRSVTVRYIFSSLFAGALSVVIWLPALLSMRGGRLDQGVSGAVTFRENMPFLDIFAKLFTGANTTSELSNGLPNIFVGILPVALAVLFFMNRKITKQRKTAAAILLVAYLLSFYIPVFNIAMHGGTVTNWFNYRDSFVFSFLLLMIAAAEWQYITEEPEENLRRAAVFLVVWVLIVFSKRYEFVTGSMVLMDCALLMLMFLAYRMHRKDPGKNPKNTFEAVVLLLVCLNLFLNYSFCTKNLMPWGKTENEYQKTVVPVSALVDAVHNSDTDFYRMEIGEQRSGNVGNDPMLYGYYGVGHGGSDDRNFVRTALSKLGVHRFNMRNRYGSGITAATDTLLGLKYIISKEDLSVEKSYDRLVNLEDWSLYRNNRALPVAFVADTSVTDVKTDLEDIFENLNNTWSGISGIDRKIFAEEEDIEFTSHNIIEQLTLSQQEAASVIASRNAASADAGTESEPETEGSSSEYTPDSAINDFENAKRGTFRERPENMHYIQFTWTVDRDGAVYSYNRSGMTEGNGSALPAINYEGFYHKGDTVTGYLPVTSSFVTEYLLQEVAGQFKAAYVDDEVLAEMSQTVLNRPIQIERVTDSHLRGSFTAQENQLLMFTIPYDEGWTCYIDGQKTELKHVLDVFMAAEVDTGEHTFEMRFVPTGLRLGAIISLVALLLLPVFLLLIRKQGPGKKEHLPDSMNESAPAADTTSPSVEANMADILPDASSENRLGWFRCHAEQIACGILALWCLMPAVMSGYDMIMASLGRFPTRAQLLEAGLITADQVNYFSYGEVLATYLTLFRILGVITLLFAAICVVMSRTRICDQASVRSMPWFYLLLGILVWAGISTLLADDPTVAFRGGTYMNDGLASYFIYGGVFVCGSMIRKENYRRLLLQMFCAVTGYLAILMVVQMSGNAFLDYAFPGRQKIVFNQFNHFGYVLCMAILASAGLYLFDDRAGKLLKTVYLADFSLLVYALLLNDTFGSYLAVVAALPVVYVFYVRYGKRIRVATLLPVLLLILLSVMNAAGWLSADGSSALTTNIQQLGTDVTNIAANRPEAAAAGTERMLLWRQTVERILQRPIFGFGPEGFYGVNALSEGKSPHNEYLQLAGYLGIPALILYICALLSLARCQWRRLKTLDPLVLAVSGCTVGYLFSACFGNPVYNTAPFFWMFLGLTTAKGEDTAPLICPAETDPQARVFTNRRKRSMAWIGGLVVMLAVAFAFAWNMMQTRIEKNYEIADLQCMRSAKASALKHVADNGIPAEPVTFWMDVVNYRLVPGDEPAPEPYGKGTKRIGRALNAFNAEYGESFQYDAFLDNQDCVVTVTVSPGEDGSCTVSTRWVQPGEA